MSAQIPDSHKDLLEKPIYVVISTVMPNGQPQSSVVWCSFDGEYIWLNTARGRMKDKNLSARPLATVLAADPANPFRYLEARCAVAEVTEEGAVEHISQLSQQYVGKSPYYGGFAPAERAQEETRVIYKLQPTKVIAFG